MNRHHRIIPDGTRLNGDHAYAVILTSLILVPLFGFAGFAVDVGAWYARASSLQKAADAAALAGVIWQPDFPTAETVAYAAAARNGFVNGENGINVTVVDSGSNKLQVVITDDDADLYFSSLFLDNVKIARSAVAEYVVAVPLGSPKNYFGTRELVLGGENEGFTAAINGSCNSHANGGQREVHYLDNSAGSCSGTVPNPDYQGDYSYQYYVNVPASPSPGQVDLFIRDPNYHSSPIENGSATITTSFRLRAPDNTPFDDTDNPIYTGCLSGSRAGSSGTYTYANGLDQYSTSFSDTDLTAANWDLFCAIPSGVSGQFILEVGTKANENNSGWLNGYGLLAYGHNLGTYTCDARYTPGCPSIVGITWMSIYANTSSGTSVFYLAEIGNEHEGKTLDITLFDPGEGSQTIRIINPGGSYQTFDWADSGGGSGTNKTSLDVTGSKFDDKFVVLTIDLPNDFDATYGTTDDWWRIEYVASGGSVTDRTTWSVEIRGDPVRLVE
jgi:Putative Flp pilus-assembly TadE/G-like